jgi:hypothetical protein
LNQKDSIGPEGRNCAVNAMNNINVPTIINFDNKDMMGLGDRVLQ